MDYVHKRREGKGNQSLYSIWIKNCTVIDELDYPNRKMLRIWYKKYLETNSCERKHRRSKYSENDRKIAVEHFLNHGRNATYTRKVLGYPSRQIMTKWICEDVKDYKTSALKGKHFVKYSQEEKKEAALDVALKEKNVSKMAKDKDVSRSTLYNWNKEFISDDLNQKINDDKQQCESTVESLKNEIASLQKEVYKLRMEKDILQKASELIKKDEGIDISALSNREKTIIINALKDTYPLKKLFLSLAPEAKIVAPKRC